MKNASTNTQQSMLSQLLIIIGILVNAVHIVAKFMRGETRTTCATPTKHRDIRTEIR